MSEFLKFPKIDVHAHYLPDTYYDAMNKYLGGNPDKFPTPTWSPEGHVEWLEKMGISYAVVSVSSPHINFSTPEINKEIVRRCNEEGAELVQKYPGKFGILASLPIPDVEGTIDEIAYASDVLQVDGFTLPTNSRGTYICEPKFEPVFEELNKRKAVVTFHPNKPDAIPEGVGATIPAPMMEFFFDTTRTITDIMLKGYLTKYPDLKFILPHAGAMLPYIVDRLVSFKPVLIDTGTMTPDFDVIEEYKKFYFDCAGNSAPHQVPDVLEIVDKTHLMYATDYPFTPDAVIMQQNEDLFNAPYMTQELRELIFYKNAMKLFPKAKV